MASLRNVVFGKLLSFALVAAFMMALGGCVVYVKDGPPHTAVERVYYYDVSYMLIDDWGYPLAYAPVSVYVLEAPGRGVWYYTRTDGRGLCRLRLKSGDSGAIYLNYMDVSVRYPAYYKVNLFFDVVIVDFNVPPHNPQGKGRIDYKHRGKGREAAFKRSGDDATVGVGHSEMGRDFISVYDAYDDGKYSNSKKLGDAFLRKYSKTATPEYLDAVGNIVRDSEGKAKRFKNKRDDKSKDINDRRSRMNAFMAAPVTPADSGEGQGEQGRRDDDRRGTPSGMPAKDSEKRDDNKFRSAPDKGRGPAEVPPAKDMMQRDENKFKADDINRGRGPVETAPSGRDRDKDRDRLNKTDEDNGRGRGRFKTAPLAPVAPVPAPATPGRESDDRKDEEAPGKGPKDDDRDDNKFKNRGSSVSPEVSPAPATPAAMPETPEAPAAAIPASPAAPAIPAAPGNKFGRRGFERAPGAMPETPAAPAAVIPATPATAAPVVTPAPAPAPAAPAPSGPRFGGRGRVSAPAATPATPAAPAASDSAKDSEKDKGEDKDKEGDKEESGSEQGTEPPQKGGRRFGR